MGSSRKEVCMASAVKTFDVEAGCTRGGRYKIVVKSGRKVIRRFIRNTRHEARRVFHRAGYKFIAWAEGRRIVCQDE